jgi:hypothetical protein
MSSCTPCLLGQRPSQSVPMTSRRRMDAATDVMAPAEATFCGDAAGRTQWFNA